jgi:hypothetical protein
VNYGVFRANFWPRVKYPLSRSNSHVPARSHDDNDDSGDSALGELDRCDYSPLSWYTGGYSALAHFFLKPKIEIAIEARMPVDVRYASDRFVRGFFPKDRTIQEINMQTITLTARRSDIRRLALQIKFLDKGPTLPPMHMNWGMGQRDEKDTIAADWGPRYIELAKDDHYRIWVWIAARTTQGDETYMYNVEGANPMNLKTMNPFIDFEIYCVPISKKPFKFRANTSSWANLDLTFRH